MTRYSRPKDKPKKRYRRCLWCPREIDITNDKARDRCEVCMKFPNETAMRAYAYEAIIQAWEEYDKKIFMLTAVLHPQWLRNWIEKQPQS